MSHAQILNLLHREADMSSGYGFGYGEDSECPYCEGSGLIGGFAGQKDIYAALDKQSMTAAERKLRRAFLFDKLASDKEKARKKAGRTPAQREKAARAILAAKGIPRPRTAAKTAEQLVANAMKLMEGLEFKE